jgi:hypothetical protein
MSDDLAIASLRLLALRDCIRAQIEVMEIPIVVDELPLREHLETIERDNATAPDQPSARGQLGWLVGKALAEIDRPVADTRAEDIAFLAEAKISEDGADELFARIARRHGEDEADLRREVEEINDRQRLLAEEDRY